MFRRKRFRRRGYFGRRRIRGRRRFGRRSRRSVGVRRPKIGFRM